MLKKFISPLTSLFIVEDSINDVIEKAKELNADGFRVTISHLAEQSQSLSQVVSAMREYEMLIRKIAKEKIDANIAIKLSAFMPNHLNMVENCLSSVFKTAKEYGIFVWIDMESPALISETLRTYKTLSKKYDVGVALQTSMKRTLKDITELSENSQVRLCKGAYRGSRSIIYKSPLKIFYNFLDCFKSAHAARLNFAVATHDNRIIDVIADPEIEFQFLYGVNFERAEELRNKGKQVLIYLPYGKNSYYYCMRRLKENPKLIISLLLRAIYSKIRKVSK